MKKQFLFLAAIAGMTLAGCTNDDLIVDNPTALGEQQEVPIVFSSSQKAFTRADYTGADAAAKLGNKFVVSGYKGSTTATVGTVVFDNYLVQWTENSANTTQSNSSNWEYVNQTRIKHAIDNGITSQAIKYWDYSQPQYDFIAWSTGTKTAIFEEPAAGIPSGSVLVSAIRPNTQNPSWAPGDDPTRPAFTFKGKASDLTDCYIADLVTVKKADYQKPVTLKFRSLGSKVRIAIYETIPGYSVRNVEFYSAAASDDAQETTPMLFTTTANNIFTKGTYTIYYPTVDTPADADNNQAHIKFAGTGEQSKVVEFGGMKELVLPEEGEKTTGNVYIGRSSSTASYAGEAEGNYYTAYLPNEAGTNLNLRVNYTLESIDGSGETIKVKGATATVPLIYTQWKAGYAYTYVFKISDKTNGYTGPYDPTKPDDITVNSDPAGLYPITFDAVAVNEEDADKTQETITLVSTPSITTYQEGSNVINNDEYEAIAPIYVTVNDGKKDNTPDLTNSTVQRLTGKAALYTIPAGKTEADIIDVLTMQDDDAAAGTIKGRNGLVLTDVTASMKLTSQVKYGVDGNIITVGTAKVGKFTPTAATTYAFVYTKTAATNTTDMFQPVAKAVDADVEGLYRYDYTTAGTGDVEKGVTYFKEDASSNKEYHTAFLGQTVNNLYTATHTPATGYAVTGTTYYYTLDNGQNYLAAAQCTYANFATAELYTFDGNTYTAKTETEPANNTAYYTKVGSTYTYCVIYPEQKDALFVLDEAADKVACASGEKAIKGQVYFDKYVQNNGVYYTKVIKVQ